MSESESKAVFDPMSVYNLFYTSLPVLAVGIFDQDVNEKNSLLYPQLYRRGQFSLFFNKKEFLLSALQGCYVSFVLFFVPLDSFSYGLLDRIRSDNGVGFLGLLLHDGLLLQYRRSVRRLPDEGHVRNELLAHHRPVGHHFDNARLGGAVLLYGRGADVDRQSAPETEIPTDALETQSVKNSC